MSITLKYNENTSPLAPILKKLREIIDERGLDNIASTCDLPNKTIINILNGKHIPSLQQFASLITACEYDLTATKDNETPIIIPLQHSLILDFITAEQTKQKIADTILEKKAKLKHLTLNKMGKNGNNYNLETIVRILQALGYSIRLKPKSETKTQSLKHPTENTTPSPTKPPFSFKGTPTNQSKTNNRTPKQR